FIGIEPVEQCRRGLSSFGLILCWCRLLQRSRASTASHEPAHRPPLRVALTIRIRASRLKLFLLPAGMPMRTPVRRPSRATLVFLACLFPVPLDVFGLLLINARHSIAGAALRVDQLIELGLNGLCIPVLRPLN